MNKHNLHDAFTESRLGIVFKSKLGCALATTNLSIKMFAGDAIYYYLIEIQMFKTKNQ